MDARASEVLDFWFGAPDDPGPGLARKAWFRKDEAFDTCIVQRFGALIELALAGDLNGWSAEPMQPLQTLAHVIVLDQFTRNAFRGTARAFAGDAQALRVARALVDAGLDRELIGVQRQFIYLPFEHAEDRELQRRSVALFAQLGRDEPVLAGLLEWAQRHHDVIERFGRFPHRNAALGRASSGDEIEFLKQPGSGF